MNDEVIFEDYNIKFIQEDFKQVNVETLEKCRVRLEGVLSKINQDLSKK